MKVGVNIRPLFTGHKLRGIGYYTESLLKALEKDEDIDDFNNQLANFVM